jgi:rubredoxin
MDYNTPADTWSHPAAPWNEREWYCPECGGHQDDVECTPERCMRRMDRDDD